MRYEREIEAMREHCNAEGLGAFFLIDVAAAQQVGKRLSNEEFGLLHQMAAAAVDQHGSGVAITRSMLKRFARAIIAARQP